MRRRLLAAVGAVVVTAVVILSAWYVLSRPKDADGDGVLDANDAFPTNPDQSKDTDGDGSPAKPDIQPGDILLVSRLAYPAGYTMAISDDSKVLATRVF